MSKNRQVVLVYQKPEGISAQFTHEFNVVESSRVGTSEKPICNRFHAIVELTAVK